MFVSGVLCRSPAVGVVALSAGLVLLSSAACSVDDRRPQVSSTVFSAAPGDDPAPGELCEAGVCASGCSEGHVQCDGERGTEVCRGGGYVPLQQCAEGATCVAGMGTAACTGGQPSPCIGGGPRDCSSDVDNDCNGLVDRLETTCECVPGTTRSCGTAACTASETCVLSSDRGSSSFAACALASETMPDPVLAALVRSRLGLGVGQRIPLAAAAELVSLSSTGSGMTRLDGIGCLTGLTSVGFSFEQISDGSPLAALPALTFVELQNDLLTDVAWLRSMPQLSIVRVAANSITDVSALRSLPRLGEVDISQNPIADLSVISDVPTLARLYLSGLGLTNLTLLSPLAGVRFLDLSSNPLTDISLLDSFPLLQEVRLRGTGLSCDLPIMASVAARVAVFDSDCPNL